MASNRVAGDIGRQIERLNGSVVQLYQQRSYREGIALATEAAILACRHLGQDHPAYAASLGNLTLLYGELGDHAAALPLFREALEITRAALGESHEHYAVSLVLLAAAYEKMG